MIKYNSINFSQLKTWLPISLILLLATGLYLYKLDSRGLWIDELISLADAEKSGFNKGRLLYYILLHFWMMVSDNDAWLRGLAVIFGLGSVFLTYRLGLYLFDQVIGLLASFMLAVSPLFINHAQEVRYYTLSVFLGLAGTLFLVYALNKPTYLPLRLGWCVMRFLAIITTPLNAALLFPDFFVVIIKFYPQTSRLFNFGKIFLLIIFLGIPAAISVKESSGVHRLNPPIPGISNVLRELRIFTTYSYPPPQYLTTFLQIFIFILMGILAIAIFKKPKSKQIFFLAIWGFVPIAIIFIFSHIFYSIWITRYLMLVYPYLFLLLAVGCVKIWRLSRGLSFVLLIIYFMALSSGLTRYYTDSKRYMGASDHYRYLGELLNSQTKPDDTIVVSSVHGGTIVLNHYYKGSATIYPKDLIESQNLNQTSIEQYVKALPPFKSRLWLVYMSNDSEKFYKTLNDNFNTSKYGQKGPYLVFLITSKDK
jgi:uncharacterized membrane protein